MAYTLCLSFATLSLFLTTIVMPAKKDAQTKNPFKRHDGDTGSPEFQIGLLSEEITQLQEHLAAHIHDYDAKKSLLKKVARRRRFMKFLKDTNIDAYLEVSKTL